MENDHETVAHPHTTYFRWLGRPYYLALQTAGASHGSSPQAIQVTQVMTDLARHDLRSGRVRVHFLLRYSWDYPVRSGNNPGIQREQSVAGNARRSGARVLSDLSTPWSINAETTRRAWRSPVPTMAGTSPRGSSPR